jgi:hypothetical protein
MKALSPRKLLLQV